MVLFDKTSVLAGVNMDDADSIRRVMNALMLRLQGATREDAEHISRVALGESFAVNRIHTFTRGNQLLSVMAYRFATARNQQDPSKILEQASNFDRLATEAVQDPVSRPPREYDMARRYFESALGTKELVFFEGGDVEFPDNPAQGKGKRKTQGSDNAKGKRKSSAGDKLDHKRPRMGHRFDDPDSDEELSDESSDDENEKARKVKARQKHKPIRNKLEKCIDLPTYDRAKAVVGTPDPSKFTIELKIEKPDPSEKGKKIYGTKQWSFTTSSHFQGFHWNNPKKIQKLNNWRYQIFNRNLGLVKNDTRVRWTIKELDRLIPQLQEHLAMPEVGGRYSRINWERLANDFNTYFQGRTFDKGEPTASTKYKAGKNSKAVKESRGSVLKVARPFVNRKATAVKNQLSHFNDPRAKKLLADAKAADRKAGQDESVTEVSLSDNDSEVDGEYGDESNGEDDTEVTLPKDPKSKGRAEANTDNNDQTPASHHDDPEDEDEEGVKEALQKSREEFEEERRDRESGGEFSKKGSSSDLGETMKYLGGC